MYQLYGDGLHDDTQAIQQMLDSGTSEVTLPAPIREYLISDCLRIHSGQTLRLSPTTRVRLQDHSDCLMLTNAEIGSHDIAVIGGIWDFNNQNQSPNPCKQPDGWKGTHFDANPELIMRYDDVYRGIIMRFFDITRLTVRDITFKDPVTFCLQLAYVTHFTIENVFFDQNDGNPTAENMDGVHIDGGCRFGLIRNVKGTCYDDVVALNADDWCDGPISDIQVDGVFGANSLRGVRLLSMTSPVTRISVNNIFGTFYQNAIGLTYFYPRICGRRGQMQDIVIRNIFASNAPRREVYNKPGPYTFSLIWVDSDIDVGNLVIENVFRHETVAAVESLHICANANIDMLQLSHLEHDNNTGTPVPAILNEGCITRCYLHDVRAHGDQLLCDHGQIEYLIQT